MNMKLGEHLKEEKMEIVKGGVADGICRDTTPAENFENKGAKQTVCPSIFGLVCIDFWSHPNREFAN